MRINDMKEFFDFKTCVRVMTNDGQVFTGIITGVNNSFDTNSNEDEIELDVGGDGYCYNIEIRDIVSIEKA